jgi:hypothetical protein
MQNFKGGTHTWKMKRKNALLLTRRFGASGGVFPQEVLWECGSLSPARTFVNPRLRQAAGALAAMPALHNRTANTERKIIEKLNIT